MKRTISSFLLLLTIPFLIATCQNTGEKEHWEQTAKIIQQLQGPKFPDKIYDIKDFGAVGDSVTMNTKAINAAIDKCSSEGGGKVLVSNGNFLTGPVHMKSNVDLHIDSTATLLFSTNPSDYLPLVYTRWEGIDCYNYSPLIYADGQTNFAITGKGTLNGQGSKEHWWPWKGIASGGYVKGTPSQLDPDCRPLLDKFNSEQVPVEKRQMGEGHYLRPQFINFVHCKNVKIEGITLINSPFWVMHPLLSENIIVRNVTVNSMGPNNDGCDPESCSNVLIENCTFNTGDDCIALKSGRNEDGRKTNAPIENVIVRNCHMKNGHGGVAIGSEISGGVKNIFVENCRMNSPELDRAIRIKTNSKRGGVTDGIFVRNVTVGVVNIAVVSINCSYSIDTEGQGNYLPMVKNVYVSDVTSEKSTYALWLQGIKGEDCVENIHISHCNFDGVKEKNAVDYVKGLTLTDVKVNGEAQGQ